MTTNPTNELSGLALRKALCERLGWRFGSLEDIAPKWPDKWLEDCWWSPDKLPFGELPALESDPGVFWPEFEKWSESTNHDYEFRRCRSQNFYRFHIYQCGVRDDPADIWIDGANLTDAGCRAWLAALEALDK